MWRYGSGMWRRIPESRFQSEKTEKGVSVVKKAKGFLRPYISNQSQSAGAV